MLQEMKKGIKDLIKELAKQKQNLAIAWVFYLNNVCRFLYSDPSEKHLWLAIMH